MPPFTPRFAMVVVAAFAATMLGCAEESDEPPGLPILIEGTYDTTVDFSKYQTYDIVSDDEIRDGDPPPGYIEANRVAVMQAILDQMSDRGLVLDDDDPDLRITPFVRLESIQLIEDAWWWDRYWGWYWGYAVPWYDRDVLELGAGTLIIDAVELGDPDTEDDDQLVFRATATALIPLQPVDVSDRIREVVADMFEYWPNEEPT